MAAQKQFKPSGATARELAASVETAIRQGELGPGERLPPIRELASSLGVSHVTVSSAYRRLQERGLLVAGGRGGTRVSAQPPLPVRSPVPPPPGVHDLAIGSADSRLLPRLRSVEIPEASYGSPHIDPELEDLLRKSFARDGVEARELALTSGALDGIERILGAWLRPGDRIGLEDPAFSRVIDLVHALGLRADPMRIDEEGVIPEELERALKRGVRAVIIAPRAQNPTGAALTRERASELRALFGGAPEVTVIEDDFAGSVAGTPFLSVVDSSERWAILRSSSKTLGADFRLAAMTGDPATISRVVGRMRVGAGWVSHILQRAVVEILLREDTEEDFRRAAAVYQRRREALIEALADYGIRALGRSGLNVWVPVREETSTVQALLREGYAVTPGERFRIASPPGIRVTIASLDEAMAPAVAEAIARATGALRAPDRGRELDTGVMS